jgi:hypothetical protein
MFGERDRTISAMGAARVGRQIGRSLKRAWLAVSAA